MQTSMEQAENMVDIVEDKELATSIGGHSCDGRKGRLIVGNCVDVMKSWVEESIQLTVTSPPYDKLRDYKGYSFPFFEIADQLYRVTADGGVVIWVVGDRINGGRSLTSFRQAIYFQEIGFSAHDVMIYQRKIHPLRAAMPIPTHTK